jgi:hypothetical protein
MKRIYEYAFSCGPRVRKTMVFESNFLQIRGEQPTRFWNFLDRHSSQTEKISRNDFVSLAERSPFSSPTSSSLLQVVYGFWVNNCILLLSNFLKWRYFLACTRNSGAKYGL